MVYLLGVDNLGYTLGVAHLSNIILLEENLWVQKVLKMINFSLQ